MQHPEPGLPAPAPATDVPPPAPEAIFTRLAQRRRCHDLPAIQGTFTASATDFHVEELPAYEPCGAGEHAYLWLEKTDLPADSLVGHVARVFGVSRRDIGCAGLKDTRATTRQFLSLPHAAVARRAADTEACAALVNTPRVRLLRLGRHGNKLRTGHLRGNRFTVIFQHAGASDVSRAEAIAARLSTAGCPNRYGTQRFGRDGSTLRHGMALLRGTRKKDRSARGQWLDKLALSAVQSALFNDYLALRAAQGAQDTILAGDVLEVRASGGLFVCDDAQVDQARFEAGEIVPAGPMFGPDMKPAQGAAAELEAKVLQRADVDPEMFTRHQRLTRGTRRATLVWPGQCCVAGGEGATLRLAYSLPSGSYATEIIGEFAPE